MKKRAKNKQVNNRKADWKNSLPLILLFFALAAIYWATGSVGLPQYILPFFIATLWLLIIPLLKLVEINKKAVFWFIRAAVFAIVAGALSIFTLTTLYLSATTGAVWIIWAIDVFYVLSIIFGIIGGFGALAKPSKK